MKTFLKIAKILAAVLAAAMFAWSCSDEGGDGLDGTVTIPEQYLSQGLTFSATGGTTTMNIVSKASALTVTADQSWCTVVLKNQTAAGTCSYEVTVTENTSTTDRTAVITIAADGTVFGSVNVYQSGADGLIVEQTSYSLSAEEQSFTVSVTSNDTPEIVCNNTWITYVGTKSMQSADYEFSVSTNYGSERTGTITFTIGSVNETVSVTQAAAEGGSMTSDAKTLASKIYAGVNIGNTLEATGGETSWGNPRVNQDYVAGLKSMGFNAVRIPCAWNSHLSDASTYTIDPSWMERVTEVVGYVLDNDMYAIVNIHWDGGWLEDNIAKGYDAAIDAEQKALWIQIAENFRGFDEHLLFAGCNEPGMNENAYSSTGVQAIMAYEQTFVDAVRATGGNNATRCLIVQGPGTDISTTVDSSVGFGMPNDTASGRLMVEIHYYDPYQFTLMEEDASWGKVFWYWGSSNYVSGSEHNATWGEEDWIKQQFGYMKTNFVDKGYPVIVGEYCAMKRTNVDNTEKHNQSRADWNEAVTRYAKDNGCVPFYWETGTDINRNNGSVKEDYAIDGIMKGASEGSYPF